MLTWESGGGVWAPCMDPGQAKVRKGMGAWICRADMGGHPLKWEEMRYEDSKVEREGLTYDI